MPFKTGYSFTASWEFTLSGTNTATFPGRVEGEEGGGEEDPGGGEIPSSPTCLGSFSMAAGGWGVAVTPLATPGNIAGTFYDRIGVTVTVSGGGLPTPVTQDFYDSHVNTSTTEVTYSYDIDLTASMTT